MRKGSRNGSGESRWRLQLDLISARALVLLGGGAGDAALRPEVHAYFYDRLWRLAACHEAAGRPERAAQLRERALRHWDQAEYGPQPPASAVAMRGPRPPLRVLAFRRKRADTPDDAA